MQDQILSVLNTLSGYVWGPPMLILLVGTGCYLSVRLYGVQFRLLWHSLRLAFVDRHRDDDQPGDISHYQALMTALAATVGTGNIAGVATAIATGGPGALFWMWVTGLVGMATKYAEAVLAVKYRTTNRFGQFSGGPMYYLANGLGQRWLGILFAIFAAVAAFGIGDMVQSNSVADALHSSFQLPHWVTGVVLTVASALVILGGIRSIGRMASALVPVMVVIYGLAALGVVMVNIGEIPAIFSTVLASAFEGHAAAGGFAGALVREAVRFGVARGVFSNESGLGSSPIAAAAAKTKDPVSQALVSMTQTFIDTIVVCSLTGFAILATGVWTSGESGATLTVAAFSQALPGEWGGWIVSIGLVLFAFSTILGWSYYGEKSCEYLFGTRAVYPYRMVFLAAIFVGAVVKLELVWTFSDLANGLMAIPNLIGLLALSGVVARETKSYLQGLDAGTKGADG